MSDASPRVRRFGDAIAFRTSQNSGATGHESYDALIRTAAGVEFGVLTVVTSYGDSGYAPFEAFIRERLAAGPGSGPLPLGMARIDGHRLCPMFGQTCSPSLGFDELVRLLAAQDVDLATTLAADVACRAWLKLQDDERPLRPDEFSVRVTIEGDVLVLRGPPAPSSRAGSVSARSIESSTTLRPRTSCS